MSKKYNKRLIKDNYSYYVEQIADLFDIDAATVRRWIRDDGLERLPNTRPHMIHSSKLRSFMEKKLSQQKKPCAKNEVFCFRCQMPRTPKEGSANSVELPNGVIRFKAICSECDGIMNRSIRRAEWTQNHPLAVFLSNAAAEHNGVQSTHPECSLQKEN